MKKNLISIGIPAFNEEANIKKLLLALLNQKQTNYVIKEIIVVSDQSTDNTIKEIQSVKSKKIIILQNRKRMGQALGQNKIIDKFSGDILILLNADVLPYNRNFISEIIQPILKDKKVGIVCPKLIPVEANGFFGKMMNYAAECKWDMVANWGYKSNLMLCSGAARAFPRQFIKQMRWPKIVAEDAYSYFYCISNHYKFNFQPQAKIFYKPADNFKDQRKQSSRFLASQDEMAEIFGEKVVRKSYSVPLSLKVLYTLKYFFRNPVLMISYLLYYLFANLNPQKGKFKSVIWDISKSSKTLSKA